MLNLLAMAMAPKVFSVIFDNAKTYSVVMA